MHVDTENVEMGYLKTTHACLSLELFHALQGSERRAEVEGQVSDPLAISQHAHGEAEMEAHGRGNQTDLDLNSTLPLAAQIVS